MPKLTVYIPTHNYARYLDKAIQSVLIQTLTDWELLVIDDGSTDDTPQVLEKYRNHPQITIITQENKGLNVTNNVAVRRARGEYIMRLDADDYLDENCLLVLSSILDQKPEVGLVYPDYHHVDEGGEILETVRRKKIGEEVELLDLPAHGACSMIRREVLLNLGTYSDEFSCQDGFDLWIKLIQQYQPYNVNIPLFYYRQHPMSLTRKEEKIHETRRQIMRRFVEKTGKDGSLKVIGVIPILSANIYPQSRPFVTLADQPLIRYTMSEAVKATSLDRVVVAATDEETISYVRKHYPKVHVFKRTGTLQDSNSSNRDLITAILRQLESESGYRPDAVCLLYISTPLRKAKHIDQAVHAMTIFDVDSVISIQEELAPCYHHEIRGLTPINYQNGKTRLERRSIFKENGAVFLHRTGLFQETIPPDQCRTGHITMLPEESVKINTDFELWLAERILERSKHGSH